MHVAGTLSCQQTKIEALLFETDTKNIAIVVDLSVNWATNRYWHTKVLATWKVQSADPVNARLMLTG